MRAFIQSSQTHIQREGAIMVQKVQVVKIDSNENPVPLNMDSSGNIGVNASGGVVSALATLQNAQTSTGVGTAMTVTGYKLVAFQIVSTVLGTIIYDFEVSVDGTNFATGALVTDHTGADVVGSVSHTGAGNWVDQMLCAGYAKVQCNITANAATGGTSVTVKGIAVA